MKPRTIFLSILFMAFVGIAWGANMCAKNDAVVVFLDPQVAGTILATDATHKTWSVEFPYGVVSGVGACYRIQSAPSPGTLAPEQNLDPYTATGSSGATRCYCKMLRPVTSQWVFSKNVNECYSSQCDSGCATCCAQVISSTVGGRIALFSTAGIPPSQQ